MCIRDSTWSALNIMSTISVCVPKLASFSFSKDLFAPVPVVSGFLISLVLVVGVNRLIFTDTAAASVELVTVFVVKTVERITAGSATFGVTDAVFKDVDAHVLVLVVDLSRGGK